MIEITKNADDLTILHELGHHELSKKGLTQMKTITIPLAMLPIIAYKWGWHKTKYKNLFTKLTSKATAATIIPLITFLSLQRFHETYADNFACQHAKDKQTLEEGLKLFKKYDTPDRQNPFNEFFIDPIHPRIKNRITKIEKTIAQRFPEKK